ncbi:23S rRNA (adenine(2503)-C(2))-methyltransferase RlmN [Blautia sp.]
MTDIKSMNKEELKNLMTELGEKPFRAKQIYSWLHEHLVTSYEEMGNIPGKLKEKLKAYPIVALEMVDEQISAIDGTRKYLFRLSDGNVIESVLMRYKHGNSVCISSQVGCKMGCRFCASTIGGWTRNLLPSEMLDQIYRIQSITGERVSNVVVMGTGEPMDNYDNIVRFVHLLSDEGGLNISQRNITVSTCGIVPKIYELAKEKLQITLALSLHAPNDEKRRELMPIAQRYSMDEVLDACRNYFQETGRRITFEYSLVAGVNDSDEDARELSSRIHDINCHVNLIPVNPIKERSYRRSTHLAVENFKIKLEKCGINVTIRREMGSDIDGACGQLRKSYMEKSYDPQ